MARRGSLSTTDCTAIELSAHQLWEWRASSPSAAGTLKCGLYIKKQEDWEEDAVRGSAGCLGGGGGGRPAVLCIRFCPHTDLGYSQHFITVANKQMPRWT